jgi:Leucine-rich repeat (LRR) protein
MRIVLVGILILFSTMAWAQEQEGSSEKESFEDRKRRMERFKRLYEKDPQAFRDSLENIEKLKREKEAQHRLKRYLSNQQPDTLKEINLNDCKLEEIPEFVFAARQCEVLKLNNNLFHKLPSDLKELTALKEISWSQNEFTGRVRIGSIPQVEKIYFSGNQLKEVRKYWLFGPRQFHFPDFKRLVGLKWLSISRNGLTRFPIDDLSKNDRLQELIANQNPFDWQEDPQFGDLPASLEVLNMNKCGFGTLPNTVYQIKSLKELQVLENELTYLPNGIADMRNLQKLSFYKNKLKEIPDGLFSLPELVVVDFYLIDSIW